MKINQMKIKFGERISLVALNFSAEISVDFSSVGKFRKLAKNGRRTKRVIPIARKVLAKSFSKYSKNIGARSFDMSKAPNPNPITTIPVTKPCLSGNHLETVATGVT